MADYRYFADVAGQPVQLTAIRHDGSIYSSAKHFSGLTPSGHRVTVERKIEFKSFARRHACDPRCWGASGKGMKCECACGGRNHGRGEFVCEAA